MRARGLAGMLTALTLTAALASCAPSATPTPTPSETGFASEAEAFAAAEETYRAYVDALNAFLAGDQEAEPLRYLSGQALTDEEEVQRILADSDRSLVGRVSLRSFKGESWTRTQVQAFVCLDQSEVRIVSGDGDDVTPLERANRSLLEIRTDAGEPPKVISSVLRGEDC